MGSNTVHLLVVDAHPGARPLPAYSHKAELRLAELLDERGAIGPDGVDRLVATVADALRGGRGQGRRGRAAVRHLRGARGGNADEVLARVARGDRRRAARCSPARRRPGSPSSPPAAGSAGRPGKLLVLDIGGGSLEIALRHGRGARTPRCRCRSAPGRLTAGWLPGDPPDAGGRQGAAPARAGRDRPYGRRSSAASAAPTTSVATSKTFKQLARIAGAARSAEGLYVQRDADAASRWRSGCRGWRR